jgi:hypothetical protein
MKDDILKFRKICGILLKTESRKVICLDMGVSDPTLTKLLDSDLDDEFKIRASMLGMVQNFNKKHREILNYAGIEPASPSVVDKEVERLNKNNSHYHPETEKKKPSPAPEPKPEAKEDFFDLMRRASKVIPKNVKLIVELKDEK